MDISQGRSLSREDKKEILCPFCDEGSILHLPSHLLTAHPGQLKSDQRVLLEDANLLLTVGSSPPTSPLPVNLSLRPSSRETPSNPSSGGNPMEEDEEDTPRGHRKRRRKQTQVPEVNKDERYWARRLKNNEAAKRSRDMRIMRERVIFEENARLERLAGDLRAELERVSMDNKELTLKMGLVLEENSRLKALLSLFQTQQAKAGMNNNNSLNNNNNHAPELLECPNTICDNNSPKPRNGNS